MQDLIQQHACIAISESKGLEFASVILLNSFKLSPHIMAAPQVILLDFFKHSPRQIEWKRYALEEEVPVEGEQ